MIGTLFGMPWKSETNQSNSVKRNVEAVAALAMPRRSGTDTYRHSPVCAPKYTRDTNLIKLKPGAQIKYAVAFIREWSRSSLRKRAIYNEMNGMSACNPRPTKSRRLLERLVIFLCNESENSIFVESGSLDPILWYCYGFFRNRGVILLPSVFRVSELTRSY